MCSLSKLRVLDLYVNTPRWRLIVLAHFAAVVLSIITIFSFGALITVWRTSVLPKPAQTGWSWGNAWIESLAFAPVSTWILRLPLQVSLY